MILHAGRNASYPERFAVIPDMGGLYLEPCRDIGAPRR